MKSDTRPSSFMIFYCVSNIGKEGENLILSRIMKTEFLDAHEK
jgi:hypothetical protein